MVLCTDYLLLGRPDFDASARAGSSDLFNPPRQGERLLVDGYTGNSRRPKPRRVEVEKRCKARKNGALEELKTELNLRGYSTERTDGHLANVLYRAADIMK